MDEMYVTFIQQLERELMMECIKPLTLIGELFEMGSLIDMMGNEEYTRFVETDRNFVRIATLSGDFDGNQDYPSYQP